MADDSWIVETIEKQRRDMSDVPRWVFDAYSGKQSQSSTQESDNTNYCD